MYVFFKSTVYKEEMIFERGLYNVPNGILNESRHEKTNNVAVRYFKSQISFQASAKCDQSRRFPHEDSLGPYLPTERKRRLTRLGGCRCQV